MSLTGLHLLGSTYQTELRSFMKKVEGFKELPYFDASDNSALVTIGIGANIDTESKCVNGVRSCFLTLRFVTQNPGHVNPAITTVPA